MRMNQSVAPTSFITSISRLRANMAVRIVFQISNTAAINRAIDKMTVYSPTNPLSLEITSNVPSFVSNWRSCGRPLSDACRFFRSSTVVLSVGKIL